MQGKATNFSELDTFVLANLPSTELRSYRLTLLTQFLANRLAFSDPAILHLFDLILRIGIIWMGVRVCGDPSELSFKGSVWIDVILLNLGNIWGLGRDVF